MTNPTVAFAEFAKTGANVDALREMAQFMTQRRLTKLDVKGRCGATCAERNIGERLDSLNGYPERTWNEAVLTCPCCSTVPNEEVRGCKTN